MAPQLASFARPVMALAITLAFRTGARSTDLTDSGRPTIAARSPHSSRPDSYPFPQIESINSTCHERLSGDSPHPLLSTKKICGF
jgi:hypothetical protein